MWFYSVNIIRSWLFNTLKQSVVPKQSFMVRCCGYYNTWAWTNQPISVALTILWPRFPKWYESSFLYLLKPCLEIVCMKIMWSHAVSSRWRYLKLTLGWHFLKSLSICVQCCSRMHCGEKGSRWYAGDCWLCSLFICHNGMLFPLRATPEGPLVAPFPADAAFPCPAERPISASMRILSSDQLKRVASTDVFQLPFKHI